MNPKTRNTLIGLFFTLLGASLVFLAFAYRHEAGYAALIARLSPESAPPGQLFQWTVAWVAGTATLIYLIMYRFLNDLDANQHSLEQAARSLKLALRSGRFGIWEWDIVNDVLTWDDRMFEIYGVSRDAFPGCVEAWQNGLHPEDRDRCLAALEAALSGEHDYDISFRVLRPGGEVRYLEADGTVIRDAAGKPLRMIGLNSDVTEQQAILDTITRERNKAQLYLDIAGVMFAAIDTAGDIRLINRRGCQILGYGESELLGRNWFELCLPEPVLPVVKEVFARQMAGEMESVEFFENSILTRGGEERIIAFHNTLLFDDAGAIRGVLFSGEDITERKEAEAALEQAASEWRAAMDASGDAIYLLDLDRRLLRANKAFYRLAGTTPEQAEGAHIAQILHPGYAGHCLQCAAEEAQTDHVTVLEAGDPENHQGLPVEVTLKMVRDGNGDPVSMLVTRHDLSFDRKAQQTLRESEERYRQLVELSQDAILINSGGRLVFINGAGVSMLGAQRPEQVLSRAMLDLVHPESRALVLEQMERAAGQMGRLPVIEVKYQRLDGDTFFGEATATSIMHNGTPAIQVFVRDVTSRKNLEEQLRHSQKLEAVGHLAGGIAHDFNNILTVIGGYGQLLEMKMPAGDPCREMVEQILASSDRAANLTRSLLAFSRKQQMHPVPCSLNEIVQNVGKFLKRIIGEDIAFEMNLAPGPLPIYADRGQIEQVVINLATNARDAMRTGGVFAVATRGVELDERFIEGRGFGRAGEYAVLCVSDNGQGMDEATRGKIFEPFFTTKEVGKGTGLGLSIVYGIVKQHSGYVEVSSEPGKGSNFHIYLPLYSSQQAAERGGPSLEQLRTGSETILVVEDEVHVRDLVDSVLRELGYRTVLAVDGQDAIEKFRAQTESIKLVFTDLIMPRMSGKELYDEVKAIDPGMKVLFTSGYMADLLQDQGGADEQFEILMKPLSPRELGRKVRELLDA